MPSRGRPAARETMSDALSRQTTVSLVPLQPIFQQGVFDKLLEQRERRAELWRRSKIGPSSAECASQWRQPSPLAMTHMRWPTEASEHGRRRGVSPVALVVPAFAHTKSPGSSPRPRVLSCLVSCHLRDVAGESRRLVDNRVEGFEQADTSSRMNTYRQQVAAHTGRTIARRQRHGDSLLQAFRGRQHLGSNLPPVLSAGRRREESRTYLRLHRTARRGSIPRWTGVLVPFASMGEKPGPSNKDAGRR